jgi:hypothetical protein
MDEGNALTREEGVDRWMGSHRDGVGKVICARDEEKSWPTGSGMPDSSQRRHVVAMRPEVRLRGQMSQIGATRDYSHPSLGGQRLEAPQSHSKALVFRIACALPYIEPMNEQSLTNVPRIALTIHTPIAHQHMEPVHTP